MGPDHSDRFTGEDKEVSIKKKQLDREDLWGAQLLQGHTDRWETGAGDKQQGGSDRQGETDEQGQE